MVGPLRVGYTVQKQSVLDQHGSNKSLNMSVPSQDYYIINRVEEIKNVGLSKNFSKYYER